MSVLRATNVEYFDVIICVVHNYVYYAILMQLHLVRIAQAVFLSCYFYENKQMSDCRSGR